MALQGSVSSIPTTDSGDKFTAAESARNALPRNTVDRTVVLPESTSKRPSPDYTVRLSTKGKERQEKAQFDQSQRQEEQVFIRKQKQEKTRFYQKQKQEEAQFLQQQRFNSFKGRTTTDIVI